MAVSKAAPLTTNSMSYEVELKELEKMCQAFSAWKLTSAEKVADFEVDVDFNEFSRRLETIKAKRGKGNVDIVIVGMTSSGKSTVVNALIWKEIIPTGMGKCTPCGVTIRMKNGAPAHYMCGGRKITLSSQIADEEFMYKLDDSSSKASKATIDLYLPQNKVNKSSVLNKNVTLNDTPGMEYNTAFHSYSNKTLVEHADALVLVIDMETGLNASETKTVLQDKNFLMKPNVIVVLNKCNRLDEERHQRVENLKSKCRKEIEEVIGEKPIFFISGKEELFRRRSESHNQKASTFQTSRKEEFTKFEELLLHTARDHEKAKRMRNAIAESKEQMLEKADGLLAVLGDLRLLLQMFMNCRVGFEATTEEAEDTAKEFFATRMRQINNGAERMQQFLEYVRQHPKKMSDLVSEQSKEAYGELLNFLSRVSEEAIRQAIDDLLENDSAEFAYVLRPFPLPGGDDPRNEDAERKWAKYYDDAIKQEENKQKEIEDQRKILNDFLQNQRFDFKEKLAMGLGAVSVGPLVGGVALAYLVTGPIGWAVGGILLAGVGTTVGFATATRVGLKGRFDRLKDASDKISELVILNEKERESRKRRKKQIIEALSLLFKMFVHKAVDRIIQTFEDKKGELQNMKDDLQSLITQYRHHGTEEQK